MKILQINKFYYLAGGTERYLFNLSRLLTSNGHAVIPFSMRDKRNQDTEFSSYFADPVEVRAFSFRDAVKTFYNYDASAKLKRLLDFAKPDIAHLHNIHHHLSPAIIPVLVKRGIPVVMTLHDYRLMCPNRQLYTANKICYRCLEGSYANCVKNRCIQGSGAKSLLGAAESWFYGNLLNIYDKIDHFIAPSRFMKDLALRAGFPEEKLSVIHNFIDGPQAGSSPQPVLQDPYLLYYGRLTPEKGVDLLLKALAESKLAWNLKIVGDGPMSGTLETQANKLGLSQRVEFTGPKYGNELEDILKQAGAVALPSRWLENMPYAMLEALAAGKPVVASRSGGMPEVVQDGKNGMLFKPGDKQEFARCLDKLSQADLPSLSLAAKQSVSRLNSSWHFMQISELYDKLLS